MSKMMSHPSAKPEDTEAQGPRYSRLRRVIVDRIVAGEYALGSLMPTEMELVTEFGISRFTVRAALKQLTDEGYIARRPGVGTRVVSTRTQSSYHQSFDSLQELFQVAVDTWYVLIRHEEVALSEELAERIGGRAGETWIRLDGVRWTEPGGRPICYIQSYIPERFRDHLPELLDYKGAFFDLLERRGKEPVERVEQEIRAVPMPEDFERTLGLRPGGWALQLLRRYRTQSGVLIASFNWHAADQMTYKMNIVRGRPAS